MPESDFHIVEQIKNIYNNGSYIRIEEDQMTAWLYLARTEKPYTKEELYTFLQDNGVTAGYHSSNIAAMAKKKVYEREIRAAVGKTSESGVDGYFEYTFTPELFKQPKVMENGFVDYTSMSELQNVKEGETLAIYHPAILGEDGYTVTGIELRSNPARDLPQAPGNGVVIEKETGEYKAAIEGKVEILNGRVDVRNVHEINGDVNLVTGRIDFVGDVIVWGSVEAGVEIKAERNIVIHGSVEAVTLNAGGDVILSRGIQGGQKAMVTAKGNVFADFIEHTNVKTGGSVHANSIINSNILANGRVSVTGRRGSLIGGYTHGLQGVDATSIGNEAEVRTTVHAGFLPENQKKFLVLKKSDADLTQDIADLMEELKLLQRNRMIPGSVPNPKLEKRITDLNKEKDSCLVRQSVIRKSIAALDRVMELAKEAKIVADGNIYRGTIVCVDADQIPIVHNTCYMRYFTKNGKLESNVIIK